MKKSYEKPVIYAESFELDQCIASCEVNHSQSGANQYRDNCVITIFDSNKKFDPQNLFIEENDACTDGEGCIDSECTDTFVNIKANYFYS